MESRRFFPRFLHALGLLALLAALPAAAAEPPIAPILRLDTGSHNGQIFRLAVDTDGQLLATASDDKTVRIWDLASARLLQVLRVPQGSANEGAVFSVAFSPDRRYVAVGGWTGFEWDRAASLYIFERSNGRVVKRIPGGPNVIYSLSWSADGRYVAAAHWSEGIRVFRASDWTLVGEDRGYQGQSYGVQFAPDGRLAAASYDGFVRLYRVSDSGLQLLAKQSAPGGGKVYSLAFSPDSRRLAVVFDDSPRINVLNADTLSLLYAPNVTGVPENRAFFAVAWSPSGDKLYAGGNYAVGADRMVRVWRDGGRGAYTDVAAANNTILHFAAIPNSGGIAYAAHDGWGVLNNRDQRTQRVESATADFRNNTEGFRISRDAQFVAFGFKQWGKDPAGFDLARGVLRSAPALDGLLAPRMSTPQVNVQNWSERVNPSVNGRPLVLSASERSTSVAIAQDERSILLGGDFSVYRFSVDGTKVWRTLTQGVAWAVNLSADGKVAVAAISDGTIRWFRYSDGKQLLSFFAHADEKRWVIWTPSGYYDASPGAEDLIGWHLNRGKEEAADFFPVSRFRSQFYRPDVIAKVLGTGDEAEALRLANLEGGRKQEATVRVEAALPPVVEIVSPPEGTGVFQPNVTLRFAVRTAQDAPVTALRARVNGQTVALPESRNLAVKAAEPREVTIPIPQADSEIMLFAENRHGVSTPATLRVAWKGQRAVATPGEEFAVRPKLYVLAIGVSKYQREDLQLEFAAKDATDFTNALLAQKGRLYRDVNVRLLTDARATKEDILDGLDWIRAQVTAKDVAMVFLAGHGLNDPDGRYYFLPANTDPERLRRTGLLFHELRDTLNVLPGKTVLFVDTCHSGNVLGAGRRTADITGVLNELTSAENGVVVFTASTGRQYSLENSAWGNGAFTKAVVEGLLGGADYKKTGRITFKMLDFYISDRVKELTNNQQTPVTIVPNGVPDFPLTLNTSRAAVSK
jgi:WD40 repeat protein